QTEVVTVTPPAHAVRSTTPYWPLVLHLYGIERSRRAPTMGSIRAGTSSRRRYDDGGGVGSEVGGTTARAGAVKGSGRTGGMMDFLRDARSRARVGDDPCNLRRNPCAATPFPARGCDDMMPLTESS